LAVGPILVESEWSPSNPLDSDWSPLGNVGECKDLEMEWIICRYIHGNMRGKSVKSIKICGKIRGSHGSLYPWIKGSEICIHRSILTDTDTNGYRYKWIQIQTDTDTKRYRYIHILAIAYVHMSDISMLYALSLVPAHFEFHWHHIAPPIPVTIASRSLDLIILFDYPFTLFDTCFINIMHHPYAQSYTAFYSYYHCYARHY
jgi:hypothetical protein